MSRPLAALAAASLVSRLARPSSSGLAAVAALALLAGSARAQVVISQVYGGGGNTGATYTHDYVELHNATSAAVDLSGWSVQYASAAGITWTATSLAGSIQPNAYYLVRLATGGAVGAPLPAPDATGTTNMSATSGKVALVSDAIALGGSGCPFAASVIDFVGYGTANCSEGGAGPSASNTTALLRSNGGCSDTQDNSADFTAGSPTPRNAASAGNGSAPTWYQDLDGDGWGTLASTAQSCVQPAGHAFNAGDCDDGDPAVHPGAVETCGNGIDDDCDGGIDNPAVGPVHNVTQGTYHCTIQSAVNLAAPGDVIEVSAGTYVEDVSVNKLLTISGAGAGASVVSGPIGGGGATFQLAASGVTLEGFTITREGNNLADWNDAGLNSAGVAIQGLALTGITVRDNLITGMRTAIDVNNSGGHEIRRNVIDFNRTGMILRNATNDLVVTENSITDNWTVGVLFLDASGGSNVPPQTALNGSFTNNDISGNWYGQIVDRQGGGSLPPSGTNLKDFGGNWLGSTTPSISNANSAEPGYAAQIPVAYGGTAVPPGGQPDVLGPAVDNFDVTPLLESGLDTDGFAYGFQGDFASLTVTSELAQVGSSGRITEGAALVATGGTVHVEAGTFLENALVAQRCTVEGAGSGANPASDTIVSALVAGSPAITIAASGLDGSNRLVLRDLRATGSTSDGVRVSASPAEWLRFDGLAAVSNSGSGINFASSGSATEIEVEDCTLSQNGNAGLRVASSLSSFSELDVIGGQIDANGANGFGYNPTGSQTLAGTGLRFSGTSFSGNGGNVQGEGDLSFFAFNGDATLTNVSVVADGQFPIQFRGLGVFANTATWLPLGTVALTNVTVTGAPFKAALTIQQYSDLSGVSMSGVDLDGIAFPGISPYFETGLRVVHAGATPLDVGDTAFPTSVVPPRAGLWNEGTGGVTVPCAASFVGALTHPEREQFIVDFDDDPAFGDVVNDPSAPLWYADQDLDGFGDPATSVQSCAQPPGHVADSTDGCPFDGAKQAAGVCGCGIPDTDTDGDSVADCIDGCPLDPLKIAPGICGCGVSDADTDGDGTVDCLDLCPLDPLKTAPGICDCGTPDTDSDGDGTADCFDLCPNDPGKIEPGTCGCGTPDTDSDGDGFPDCVDPCPGDPNKQSPGICGCGVPDTDTDGDGVADCLDNCPTVPNANQSDLDGDQFGDVCDNCPVNANPGQEDCDGDDLGDLCAILLGVSEDCNDNGIPDTCDVATLDCNGNGTPDDCDIDTGSSLDLNLNSIPDECDATNGVAVCFGDGSGTPCPCVNGAPGEGCRNTSGSGARIYNLGGASFSADDAFLVSSGLPQNVFGMFFTGTNLANGGLGVPFGAGVLCVNPIKRFPVQHSGALGAISRTGLVALSPGVFSAGSTWYFQCWYRDPSGACTLPRTFNTSHALQIQFVP